MTKGWTWKNIWLKVEWEDSMPGRTQIAHRQSDDTEINMRFIVVKYK